MLTRDSCPSEVLESVATRRRPRALYQAAYHIRHHGLLWTIASIWQKLAARLRKGARLQPAPRAQSCKLNLQAGELVEVKSREEVLTTLDAAGKNRGLLFLPEMERYCGHRFRVHRRIERMYLEGSGEIRTIRDTVLLQNVFCSGSLTGCDKSCFLYWREAWLKRVQTTAVNEGARVKPLGRPARIGVG